MSVIIHIFGVGSALLILSDWAMREPLAVGWVTGTDSTFFAIYDKHKSKLRKMLRVGSRPAQKIIYYEQVFVTSDVISDDDNVCVLVHCL